MLGEMFIAGLVHWVVGKGADKGLEYLRGNSEFNRDIEKAVKKWAKARGMTQDIFFSPVSGETDEGKGKHLTVIREKLHTGWPEIEEWHQAFIERWEYINKNLKGRHEFFDLNRAQAEAELKELAKAVYGVCKRNTDVFQRAVIDKLDGLKEEMRGRVEIQTKGLKVSTSKLPVTGRELFGRDEQLKILDEAWGDDRTKIISFVAWGGVGKTALVNEWLNRMGEKNWQGAQRVYGWSFYSQGTKEAGEASSDTFLANALKWFGDKETAGSAKSPWDKGVRLAELVRGQKTLLILDGVEPLQYPPGQMNGQLKDHGLQALLRELSHSMDGLCVITTREKIKDIQGQVGHSVKLVELENLSPEAGMQVLRKAGVKGTDKELMQASEEFGGHALALTLLGNFLTVVHKGEIRKRDLIPALMDEEEQGGHAKRVMKSYEIWLKDNNRAELEILYMMGLFDRPAEKGAIDALRAKPAIRGLTKNLAGLSDAKRKYAVEHLRELRLLAKEEKDRPDDLDCHPLVREYFGGKLKKNKSEAWQEGHRRLYEYYKGVPKKGQPDTLEEMEPLFRAVYHGCAAGRYKETLYDVFHSRLGRGEAYVGRNLGAYSSTIAALSGFFERPWNSVVAELKNGEAYMMDVAGFCLQAMGRLREAAEPMEAGLKIHVRDNTWVSAAMVTMNLSELYLALGDVEKAVEYGRRSVEYADKSGDEFERMSGRTTLADALHQAGQFEESRQLFEKAERRQRKNQPMYPYLYSLRGYQYCDLLLVEGKTEEVKERARQTLKWVSKENWLLFMALDKVLLGRAWLAEAAEQVKNKKAKGKNVEEYLIEAKRWLNEAVNGLRKAGEQIWLAKGLLVRAGYYRVVGEYEKAWGDLEEAREIAERGEMKRWLADYHLEAAKLALCESSGTGEQGNRGRKSETGSRPTTCRDARRHYEEAKRLIEECGYHRRDKELEELAGRI
jgi:tetratricopeptide (TPR) repeat protein